MKKPSPARAAAKRTASSKNPASLAPARGAGLDWTHVYPWIKPAFVLLALGFAWFGQEALFARHLAPGLWLWLGAAVFAGFAFWKQPDQLPGEEFPPAVEAAAVAGIVIIALAVRLIRLDKIPNGYFFDEGMNALIGLQMLKDPHYLPIFGPADAPLPTLYHYFNAFMMQLGGISAYASKMVPVFLGTATVAVFYFLARRVVSRPVALAAALILALMRWHVNFSRINFVGIATPLFGAAAAYFLLRGMETKNRWHMALSGLSVSLGLYTYYASNLVPLVLGPYMALQLAWDRNFLKEQWKGLLVFLVVSLAVFAPLGWFAYTNQGTFFSRNNQVLIFNHVAPEQAATAFWRNVRLTLLMFNYFGDTNGRHNIPEEPMLDPVTGLLFGLGVAWSLTHPNRKHALLALFWFLVALVPGFLTIEAPQGYRCIGAIVPVALLSALGLERIWQAGKELTAGTPAHRWLWIGLALVAVVIGQRTLTDYFGRQANHMACWSEFSAREAAMGRLIRELGPDYHTYISSSSFNYPTIRFLAYPHADSEAFQIGNSIPSSYAGKKNLGYMLLPVHSGAMELLRYYYPGGREQTHASPYDFDLFSSYLIPRKVLEANQGLQAHYVDSQGRSLTRLEGGSEFFQVRDLKFSGPVSASWTGSIRLPRWGVYAFRLEGAQGTLRINGRAADGGPLALVKGQHRVEIYARIPDPRRPASLLLQTNDGPWNPVPVASLSPRTAIHGLAASYWNTTDWTGQPIERRIDPLIALLGEDFPLAAPFSARWQGEIEAPLDGTYSFGTFSNEYSWVYVDDKEVVRNERPDSYQEESVVLKAGRHKIRVDYQKTKGAYPRLELYWATPKRPKHRIPFTVLFPETAAQTASQ